MRRKKGFSLNGLAWAAIVIFIILSIGSFFFSGFTGLFDSGSSEASIVPSVESTPGQTPPPKTVTTRKSSPVTTVVRGLPRSSRFNALFRDTEVAERLTGEGPFTILVPTDAAFAQLPAGTVDKMTDEQKLRFVQYHIVAGQTLDVAEHREGTVQALSGDPLTLGFGAGGAALVNSAIFIQKYEASNGVVYRIDNVLLPPQR